MAFWYRVLGGHTLLQQCTEKPRNAGIPAGGFNSSPLRPIFFEGHSYIAQASRIGHKNGVTTVFVSKRTEIPLSLIP
jgi:hypothetical protein